LERNLTQKTDRRIIKTRAAIYGALVELMKENRFETITIQNIANLANVNRGTIYLHFTDKYNLLDQLIAEKLSELELVFEIQFMQNGICIEDYTPIFQYFQDNFDFYSVLLTDSGIVFFHTCLRDTITKITTIQNKGVRPEGLHVDIVNEMVASGFSGLIEWWIKNNLDYTPEEMANQMSQFFQYAFGSRRK